MKWRYDFDNIPENTVFIADIELPFSVCAIWNEASGNYTYGNLTVDFCEGEWNDVYFENVSFSKEDLLAWCPMPKPERE